MCSFSSLTHTTILFALLILAISNCCVASSAEEILPMKGAIIRENFEVIEDLNVSKEQAQANKMGTGQKSNNVVLRNSWKNDIEVLEPVGNKKPTVELEERFRAPSVVFSTDTIKENIETLSESAKPVEKHENHLVLTISLIMMVFISICIYAAFVICRSITDQRYDTSQLLVNQDDYFHQSIPNLSASAYNSTTYHQCVLSQA